MKYVIRIFAYTGLLVVLIVFYFNIDALLTISLPTEHSTSAYDNYSKGNTLETNTATVDATQYKGQKTMLSIGDTYEDTQRLASGSLLYTITNARVVDSIPETASVDCFMYDEFLVWAQDTGWVEQKLPYYINDDMSVKGGHYLLFVDVMVESNEARCFTRSDFDAEGYPLGQYEDPYIFRSDMLFLVNTDIPDPYVKSAYHYFTLAYFSQKHQHADYPANHVTYRLEPGDTISFTIGYHFEKSICEWVDSPIDFSNFCVTTIPEQSALRINLELEGTIE